MVQSIFNDGPNLLTPFKLLIPLYIQVVIACHNNVSMQGNLIVFSAYQEKACSANAIKIDNELSICYSKDGNYCINQLGCSYSINKNYHVKPSLV